MVSATSDIGTKISPMPNAVSIIGPSRPPAYVLCSLIRDSQNIPPVPSTAPVIISGRAPIRLTSCEATADATMIVATIGR